ncbi:MAG TPA: PadR family transcriptional regulator [Dehalococcoidales bacterium]|nr:PadR family transcriptional regulator [Dehalococcoidales bacterium]
MSGRDINEVNRDFQKGLYTGISVLILLGIVGNSREPIYGYQIAKIVESNTADVPIIKLGTLYPILRGLENDGLLESKIDPSVTGPPRKYYTITAAGRQALEQLTGTWKEGKKFMDSILAGARNDK